MMFGVNRHVVAINREEDKKTLFLYVIDCVLDYFWIDTARSVSDTKQLQLIYAVGISLLKQLLKRQNRVPAILSPKLEARVAVSNTTGQRGPTW